jgi:aryl-alcohol dehydrogenase-like predicted oxidoreductase
MAFLMNQPMNVFALVGCQTGEEFASSSAALDIKLTAEEVGYLDLKRSTPA